MLPGETFERLDIMGFVLKTQLQQLRTTFPVEKTAEALIPLKGGAGSLGPKSLKL